MFDNRQIELFYSIILQTNNRWCVMKNIVVAGCGHGGLVAAGLLSKAGYNVNVYEQKTKENLPYDWTDIFDIRALTFAGLELPLLKNILLKSQ